MDFADIDVAPFNNEEAIKQMENGLLKVLEKAEKYVIIGGDHTISYPSLKAMNKFIQKICNLAPKFVFKINIVYF